jgi:hypothetical protein
MGREDEADESFKHWIINHSEFEGIGDGGVYQFLL